MAGLRHPNLEFLLAHTRTPVAAVTERTLSARPLEEVMTASPLSLADSLRIAVDVGRGLLYLHTKSGQAHGGVAASSVMVDSVRRRAFLRMLCRPIEGGSCGFVGDARALVQLLLLMIRDNDDLLRNLALENPNNCSLVALNAVIGILRAHPGESCHLISMNSLLGVLKGTLYLVSPVG